MLLVFCEARERLLVTLDFWFDIKNYFKLVAMLQKLFFNINQIFQFLPNYFFNNLFNLHGYDLNMQLTHIMAVRKTMHALLSIKSYLPRDSMFVFLFQVSFLSPSCLAVSSKRRKRIVSYLISFLSRSKNVIRFMHFIPPSISRRVRPSLAAF